MIKVFNWHNLLSDQLENDHDTWPRACKEEFMSHMVTKSFSYEDMRMIATQVLQEVEKAHKAINVTPEARSQSG